MTPTGAGKRLRRTGDDTLGNFSRGHSPLPTPVYHRLFDRGPTPLPIPTVGRLFVTMNQVLFGGQNMVEPLRRVVVRRPDKSFGDADPARWHYVSQPGLRRAQQEHEVLSELLRVSGGSGDLSRRATRQPGRRYLRLRPSISHRPWSDHTQDGQGAEARRRSSTGNHVAHSGRSAAG